MREKRVVVVIGGKSSTNPAKLKAELTKALKRTGYTVEVSRPDSQALVSHELARLRAMRRHRDYRRASVCVVLQEESGKTSAWYNRIGSTTVVSMPAVKEFAQELSTDLTGRPQ
jgi:hypothetical protein